MVTILNADQNPLVWGMDTNYINYGYPIFLWQLTGVTPTEISSLIMTWKIPANVDGVGQGTTIKLPIPADGTNNYQVDWGDGSAVENVGSAVAFKTHTYTNSVTQEYVIKISGTLDSFGYKGETQPTTSNTYKNYYTFCEYLTNVIRFGELSSTSYGFAFCTNLSSVSADAKPETFENVIGTQNMFYNCSSLTSVNMENCYTNNVTSMQYMFYGCSNLEAVDINSWENIGGWDTSNVINMQGMFYACANLTTVNMNQLNTSSNRNTSYMFAGCTRLETLDLDNNFDTSRVTTMQQMFLNCSSLTGETASEFSVSNWNVGLVTNMESLFLGCTSLTTLDVSLWNTNSAITMYKMFLNCERLKPLNVANWNTGNVMTMAYMFNNCRALEMLDVSRWDTHNVIDISYMFQGCSGLTYLNLDNWSTERITTDSNMQLLFKGCTNLKDILLGAKFAKLTGNGMFDSCTSLRDVISLYDNVMALPTSGSGTSGYLSLTSGALYVPSVAIEQAYESDAKFANAFGTGSTAVNKVEPILQVKGDNPVIVEFGETYTIVEDEGAYVASYSNKEEATAVPYTVFGFSVNT